MIYTVIAYRPEEVVGYASMREGTSSELEIEECEDSFEEAVRYWAAKEKANIEHKEDDCTCYGDWELTLLIDGKKVDDAEISAAANAMNEEWVKELNAEKKRVAAAAARKAASAREINEREQLAELMRKYKVKAG